MNFTCLQASSLLVWAWRREEPTLASQELLVAEGGNILEASPGLRRIGIEPGQALERAQALAQEQALEPVIRPHPGLRVELAWETALQSINQKTPWLESPRPGLATANLEPTPASQLTHQLDLRAGMASDRQLAYLAALTAADQALVQVGNEPDFRQNYSVVTLHQAGVSQDTVQNLLWLGFPRLAELARLNEKQLRNRFAEGELLNDLVHGRDRRPVPLYHPPPEATAQMERLEPWSQPAELEPVARHLLDQTLTQLEGRRPRWLTLTFEEPDGNRLQARRGLHQPTASLRRLWPPLQQQLTKLWRPHLEVESIHLALGGLLTPARTQGVLWTTRSPRQVLSRAAQVRCPGQLKMIELHHPQAYLPEEAWSFRPL